MQGLKFPGLCWGVQLWRGGCPPTVQRCVQLRWEALGGGKVEAKNIGHIFKILWPWSYYRNMIILMWN